MTKPTMPPAVAFLDAAELMSSGSPLYRVHRPANVLGHQSNWITLVTSQHAPPEGNHPWLVEVEGQALCPQVLILRPTMLAEMNPDPTAKEIPIGDRWDAMRRHVEAAQKQGQIVLLDLDDHPYAWNALHPDEAFDAATWEAHDAYVASFNAVLCSTQYLVWKVMQPRFSDKQQFHYAPNLYDPWRYHPERAKFGKVLGSHIYVKARDQADFDVLGNALRPILQEDPDLEFLHIGEEYSCGCGHRMDEHWEDEGPCDNCSCNAVHDVDANGLAKAANLPREQIRTQRSVSPWELPEALTYNVGVVPLADSEWNWAKTEGKGFEMAAAGIPFIALTGEHPLYKKAPKMWGPDGIDSLWHYKTAWQQASVIARKWAERIAQEHQIEYIAVMRRLAASNLAK